MIDIREEILSIIQIVNRDEFYFGKTLDAFALMPSEHQEGLIKFFNEEVGHEKWHQYTEQPELYPDFIKCVLMYYSGGIKDTKAPDRNQLIEMLGCYLESGICADIVSKMKLASFEGALEDVDGVKGTDGRKDRSRIRKKSRSHRKGASPADRTGRVKPTVKKTSRSAVKRHRRIEG